MRRHRQTLRVWDWHPRNGGVVRLALKPDKPIIVRGFSRDDEGWSRWTAVWTWERELNAITYGYRLDGTDCDGRHCNMHFAICRMDACGLPALRESLCDDGETVRVCAWELTGRGQRDYSAEAAGY